MRTVHQLPVAGQLPFMGMGSLSLGCTLFTFCYYPPRLATSSLPPVSCSSEGWEGWSVSNFHPGQIQKTFIKPQCQTCTSLMFLFLSKTAGYLQNMCKYLPSPRLNSEALAQVLKEQRGPADDDELVSTVS